ncbi:bleomycin resistance protein [Streptomyces sp. NPDC057702]|uniref:bleomycin resistance protein n=1 Tax=unclassified Streptomyces TaxID=2593676 RepID=UPI0036BB9ADD
MTETTTPVFPCPSIPETLAFYRALGFEVTFEQTRPNPYAVVERGAIALHFFGTRRYDPATSSSTCLISTDAVDDLHTAFRAGLRAAYGRVPTRGLPRIGPLKDTTYGVRQFLVTDPGGNCLRVGQPTGESLEHAPPPPGVFARALHLATLLGDAKEDHRHAARVLDQALSRADAASAGAGEPAGPSAAGLAEDPTGQLPTAAEWVRALVLRADLAIRLDEPARGAEWLRRATAVTLTDAERATLADTLRRAEELREELGP